MPHPGPRDHLEDSSSFSIDKFRVVADDGFTVVNFDDPVELHVDDWDEQLETQLNARACVVDLSGAPRASWVLARLAALMGQSPTEGPVELVDDAVFVVDFVVWAEDAKPVAKVQIQGGMIGVGLLGVQERRLEHRLIDALTQALVASPQTYEICSVRVRDPDWLEAPSDYTPSPDAERFNAFGWDGQRLLGADNVRPVD